MCLALYQALGLPWCPKRACSLEGKETGSTSLQNNRRDFKQQGFLMSTWLKTPPERKLQGRGGTRVVPTLSLHAAKQGH